MKCYAFKDKKSQEWCQILIFPLSHIHWSYSAFGGPVLEQFVNDVGRALLFFLFVCLVGWFYLLYNKLHQISKYLGPN